MMILSDLPRGKALHPIRQANFLCVKLESLGPVDHWGLQFVQSHHGPGWNPQHSFHPIPWYGMVLDLKIPSGKRT